MQNGAVTLNDGTTTAIGLELIGVGNVNGTDRQNVFHGWLAENAVRWRGKGGGKFQAIRDAHYLKRRIGWIWRQRRCVRLDGQSYQLVVFGGLDRQNGKGQINVFTRVDNLGPTR